MRRWGLAPPTSERKRIKWAEKFGGVIELGRAWDASLFLGGRDSRRVAVSGESENVRSGALQQR